MLTLVCCTALGGVGIFAPLARAVPVPGGDDDDEAAQRPAQVRTTNRPDGGQRTRSPGRSKEQVVERARARQGQADGDAGDARAADAFDGEETEPEPPAPTPEALAAEIRTLLEAGQNREGIRLLEQFDALCPPPASSGVDGLHSLDVMRLKRRLLERASAATGRAIFPEENAPREGKRPEKRSGLHVQLDGIDAATRVELQALRSKRKAAVHGCRDLLEAGDLEGALAALDALAEGLEALPDPQVWSSLRLLRAKCLALRGDVDAARVHVSQVCDYFHGPDAFGLHALRQPHATVGAFTEVIDYVLDAELLEPGSGYVDLHPAKMITRVEVDERARGRFLLINPSPVDACVTLYADGLVRERTFSGGVWSLVWDPFLPPRHRGAMRPVCIPPFGQLTILLEAPLLNDTPDQLVQISAGGFEVADWHFSTLTADEPSLVSEVVDASYNVFNPFYRTPVTHELYYRGSGGHITNFRVEASYPCHIDYYDAETGKLLARDVEGDGFFDNFDFDRAGFDNDYNLFPDLLLDPQRPVIPIELEITPIVVIPEFERDVTLSVQILDNGQWLETAQDVVLFP